MKCLFYIFVLSSIYLNAQDSILNKPSTVELRGYVKYMDQLSFIDKPDTGYLSSLIHNRLNFKWTPTKNWLFRIETRNRIFYGDQLKSNRTFMKTIGQDQGIIHLSKVWVDEYALGLHSIVDRSLVNYTNEHFDITVGRQRINWGLNIVWNPNDIFNTYNFFDFDYEERPGSDALRIQYNWKGFSGFEFAAKKGNSKDDQVAALLFRSNHLGYDYQCLAGIYNKELVLGIGWAGSIKDAGFKGEFSYFHPNKNLIDTVGVLNGSMSFDYSFKNGFYIHLSGYYNSIGNDKMNMMSTQNFFDVNPKQLLPFRFAGFFQMSKQINPLFTFGITNIYSPTNQTWVMIPNIHYSISSNWEVTLLGQSFFSDVNSVYRTLGNSIFLRFKCSF